jgi:hypothetical protein
MRNAGWESGKGLGPKEQGISLPLVLKSQNSKTGLGYEKLPKNKNICVIEDSSENVIEPLLQIGTIYDDVETFPDKLRKDFIKERKRNGGYKFVNGGVLLSEN